MDPRLPDGRVESLFDLGPPAEVAEQPADRAGLLWLLNGTALVEPIARALEPGGSAAALGGRKRLAGRRVGGANSRVKESTESLR